MPPPVDIPPMAALADWSVFPYLHDDRRSVRSAAVLELTGRGYRAPDLTLASVLGSDDVDDRIAITESLTSMREVDPRRWLGYLCRDTSRAVRSKAVAVLATMSDPAAGEVLRQCLQRERDVAVASKIRRYLDLR